MSFSKQDLDTLAKTIYGEARGELRLYGISPLVAVANVVVNRKKKKFAGSVHEVCTAPFQFSCWNKNDPNYEIIKNKTNSCAIFGKCLEIAENVLTERWPDITDGCDHYHTRSIRPYWAIYLVPKRIFGTQYFYSLRNY